MKRAIIAALLMCGAANAEVLVDGKVYPITSDRIIKRDHLPCAYSMWTQETLPDGTLVLTRAKRCEGASDGK